MADIPADELFVRSNRLDLMEALADDLAHEIKNPLHSMALHLEILRRRVASASGIDSEEVERYFGRLSMDLERASGRLEVLLRLARPPRDTRIALNDAVHGIEEILRVEAKRHKLRLELELGSVKGDLALPAALAHQLFLNMIRFACGQAPEHAALVIRTGTADRGASFTVAVAADGDSALPRDEDSDLDTLRRVARFTGVDLQLGRNDSDEEDWHLTALIASADGTPSPPPGV